MTERERDWDERVRDWLDSLDQPLRSAAETVVDEYLNPVRYESIEQTKGWQPQAGVKYAITVNFDSAEIGLISEKLDGGPSPHELMKEMLLSRATEVIAERRRQNSDSAAAS